MPDVSPVEIRRVEDRELHVSWADGHRSVFSNRMLREDIRAEEVTLVGRYAIRIRWSDRHSTGIYTFQKLREWCACDACGVRP
jgi:DUF971 family protein